MSNDDAWDPEALRWLARETFLTEGNSYGCAETVLVVLKYAYDLPAPADSAPAMALNGGVAWSGGVCGTLSGAALAVGALAGRRIADHHLAKTVARQIIDELLLAFEDHFGSVTCGALVGDIRGPEAHARFIASGVWRDSCMRQIEFVVTRLGPLADRDVWQAKVDALQRAE